MICVQKLYSIGAGDINTGLVKVTARILGITYNEINVNSANQEEYKNKSLTGKFPVLETQEGLTLFEGVSIAKYFAR